VKRVETKIKFAFIFELEKKEDDRGSLIELFRSDQAPFIPEMAYISQTKPGVMRGPHQHEEQTDMFIFQDGKFEIYLWNNKGGMPVEMEVHTGGAHRPLLVVVPPRTIHAYKNVLRNPACVINAPDRLYAGPGKLYPVDEIRFEDNEAFMNKWFSTKVRDGVDYFKS